MSWKVEVIADDTMKWLNHGLRFATAAEAEAYAVALAEAWTAVRRWRVSEVDDPVAEEQKSDVRRG